MIGADSDRSEDGDDDAPEHLWESRPVRWSAVSGLLLAVGFVAERFGAEGWWITTLFVASTIAGARFFAVEAFGELWREREIGIELLMTVAVLTAGGLGVWEEAAALAFLYSISEALEEFTEDRTRGAIRALMDLAPKRVTRLVDGREEEVDAVELRVGDQFLVRPGEGVATDGTVIDGHSAVNESAVTGESVPIEKSVGSKVIAGTLNTTGALVAVVSATSENNTLAQIVHIVTEAQEAKGQGERAMSRFARIYSPAVLGVGVLVAVIGGLATQDWKTWLVRAATVLVAAAPCALVISIPIAYVAAIGNASRKGVLIKGGVYLEELAQLKVLALDKTGTITQGTPQVVTVQALNGFDEHEVLALGAAVEKRSEHPLAKAIVQRAEQTGVTIAPATDFQSMTGAGAQAKVGARRVLIASPSYFAQAGITHAELDELVPRLQSAGQTAVVVAADHVVVGIIGIADVVRPQARGAVQSLRATGLDHVVMLTGDNQRTASAIAEQVGIDEVQADLSPEDKSRIVGELTQRYGRVGMVGDGVNDAPALAAASVGIAMGTAGSDVALETADVALMADDLTKLTEALRIGRRTRVIVRQNLILSIVILAVLIPGALVGVLALPAAVLAHELSELFVIGNGLRLARR